jgi:hypothetical protein
MHKGGQSTTAKLLGGATTLLSTPVGAALDVAGTGVAAYNLLRKL